MDKITLRRMPFELPIGKDAWGREKAQPVLISVEVQYDVSQAAVADDVSKTLDYGKAYKSLKKKLETFPASIGELILDVVGSLEPAEISLLEIILPKGNLRADGGLHFFLEAVDPGSLDLKHYKQSLNVRGIRCACIIGVNPHEREEEQIVVVNLDFKGDMALANGIDLHNALKASNSLFSIPYADVVRKVVKVSITCLKHEQWPLLDGLLTTN